MGRQQKPFFSWISKELSDHIVLFAVVTAVLLMGVLAGVFSGSSLDTEANQELALYVNQLFTALAEQGTAPSQGVTQIFTTYFVKTTFLLWVLGLSVIGAPAIAAFVFLRGFAIGFSAGFLASDLAWRGGVLAIIALLPHNILIVPGLIWLAVGAIAFSLAALRIMLGRPHTLTIFEHLQAEGALVLWGCVLVLGGGLVESYVTPGLAAIASRLVLR